jgi:hypothetical protein
MGPRGQRLFEHMAAGGRIAPWGRRGGRGWVAVWDVTGAWGLGRGLGVLRPKGWAAQRPTRARGEARGRALQWLRDAARGSGGPRAGAAGRWQEPRRRATRSRRAWSGEGWRAPGRDNTDWSALVGLWQGAVPGVVVRAPPPSLRRGAPKTGTAPRPDAGGHGPCVQWGLVALAARSACGRRPGGASGCGGASCGAVRRPLGASARSGAAGAGLRCRAALCAAPRLRRRR